MSTSERYVSIENLALALNGIMQGQCQSSLPLEDVLQVERQSVTDNDLGPLDHSLDAASFSGNSTVSRQSPDDVLSHDLPQ